MTPEDFKTRFKTLSHGELLNILDNPDQYEPAAVVAATRELENRQLSQDQVDEARAPFLETRLREQDAQERRKAFGDQVGHTGRHIFDIVNPIPKEPKSPEKIVQAIVLVYALVNCFSVFRNYRSLLAEIKDFPEYPMLGLFVFTPLIVLAVALVALWRMKRLGWLLFMSLNVFYAMTTGASLWQSWRLQSQMGNFKGLFHMTSPWVYAAQLLVLMLILAILCKSALRNLFGISKQGMWQAITGGVLYWTTGMVLLSNGLW